MSIINFTVEYDALSSLTDSDDLGADADVQPLVGTVTFTPVFSDEKQVLAPGYSPRPACFTIRQFVGVVDTDGRLKSSKGGSVGVRLWANDPVFDLDNLTYRVDFNLSTVLGEKIAAESGYISAPADDATINLADVLEPTGSPSIGNSSELLVYAHEIVDASDVGVALMTASTPAAAAVSIGLDSGNVYNWKSSNTKKVKRSLAKAMSGSTANHMIIGDSESSLYVGTTNYLAVWPYVLRQLLNARGVPLAGTGWVFPVSDGSLPMDPRWTRSGTWTQTGGFMYTASSGASATFTSDLPGTTVAVAYSTASTAFSVSVDGGAAVTVTPGGAYAVASTVVASGLADTTHTVTITNPSTGTFIPVAAQVYKSAGLTIHNCAQSGTKASEWASAEAANRGWMTNTLGLTPDVIHIALGVNDLMRSRTAAQTITALTTIRNRYSNADCILYGQMAPSPSASVDTPPSDATWADYISRLYTLADTLDCPLIDLYQRNGSYATASAAGLMGDDIHPNAIAHADWALLVANCLTAKAV